MSKSMPRLLSCLRRLQSSRPGPSARSGTLALSAACHAAWNLVSVGHVPQDAWSAECLRAACTKPELSHFLICGLTTTPLSLQKQSCSLTRQGQRLLVLFVAATAGATAGACQ